LDSGTPEDKAAALLLLTDIAQHPACPSAQCVEISIDVMFEGTEEQKEQGGSVLLSLLQNRSIHLEGRIQAGRMTFSWGTPDQKAQVYPLLVAVAQEPTCTPLQRAKIARELLEWGTEEQKSQACPILLSLLKEPTIALEERLRAGAEILTRGTPEENAEASSFLMGIAEDSRAPEEARAIALEALFTQGTRQTRMEILLRRVSDGFFAHHPCLPHRLPRNLIAITPELRAFLLQHAEALYGENPFTQVTLMPPEVREDLVYALAAQPQDLWQAITARIMNAQLMPRQVRYFAAIMAFMEWLQEVSRTAAVASEVHDYARSVEDPVMAAVDQRLQGVPRASYNEARGAVATWITQNERDSAKANEKVDEGLATAEDRDLLARVYTFVLTQHPDKMHVFLQGFVRESMTAFSGPGAPTSCPKGIKERVFTGLRGMDPALDTIFQGPETILTAKTFIAQCNFGASDNALQWVVKKLKDLHVTAQTSAQDAVEIFKTYATDHLKSLPLRPGDQKEYLDQLESMAEILLESYDDHIKPLL